MKNEKKKTMGGRLHITSRRRSRSHHKPDASAVHLVIADRKSSVLYDEGHRLSDIAYLGATRFSPSIIRSRVFPDNAEGRTVAGIPLLSS